VISNTFGTKATAGNAPASQKEENEKYENKSSGRGTAEGQQEYEKCNSTQPGMKKKKKQNGGTRETFSSSYVSMLFNSSYRFSRALVLNP
jgi:hypothetical protein